MSDDFSTASVEAMRGLAFGRNVIADVAAYEPILKSIRTQVVENFFAQLEPMLRKGVAAGLDLAVSTDLPVMEMIFVTPGSDLPRGRSWTVYHSSNLSPDVLEYLAANP